LIGMSTFSQSMEVACRVAAEQCMALEVFEDPSMRFRAILVEMLARPCIGFSAASLAKGHRIDIRFGPDALVLSQPGARDVRVVLVPGARFSDAEESNRCTVRLVGGFPVHAVAMQFDTEHVARNFAQQVARSCLNVVSWMHSCFQTSSADISEPRCAPARISSDPSDGRFVCGCYVLHNHMIEDGEHRCAQSAAISPARCTLRWMEIWVPREDKTGTSPVQLRLFTSHAGVEVERLGWEEEELGEAERYLAFELAGHVLVCREAEIRGGFRDGAGEQQVTLLAFRSAPEAGAVADLATAAQYQDAALMQDARSRLQLQTKCASPLSMCSPQCFVRDDRDLLFRPSGEPDAPAQRCRQRRSKDLKETMAAIEACKKQDFRSAMAASGTVQISGTVQFNGTVQYTGASSGTVQFVP